MGFYNSEQLIAYINDFGAYAQAIAFILFAVQAMAPFSLCHLSRSVRLIRLSTRIFWHGLAL